MSRSKTTGTYWLSVVDTPEGYTVLEAEIGYKPCCRPGEYRVMVGPEGPVCPGCNRVCRIPDTAGLTRGDEIVIFGVKPKFRRPSGDGFDVLDIEIR